MSSEEKPGTSLATLTKIADPTKKTKEGLLHILDDSFSDYSDIDLTTQESARMTSLLKRLSTGSSSFALLHCTGHSCPFATRCPLVQMNSNNSDGSVNRNGKAPVGKDCLMESTLMRDSATSYLQEFQVDPVNFTEVNIVTELAEIEVLLYRINMQLALPQHALLTIQQTIGFDRESGRAITQEQVAPLFEQKQKLAARKSKLVKVMVGDRQEKYKKEAALKQKPDMDASSQMSSVKKQLSELQQHLRLKSSKNIQEAEVISPEDFMNGVDTSGE